MGSAEARRKRVESRAAKSSGRDRCGILSWIASETKQGRWVVRR